MVEILLGAWLASLVLSLPLTAWNIGSVLKLARSKKLLNLNENLKKLGLFWSITRENFQSLEQSNPEDDAKKSIRNFILLGALGLFSVLGLFILFVVTVSIHKLIRNRTAEQIFKSELAQKQNLEPKQVETLVASLT